MLLSEAEISINKFIKLEVEHGLGIKLAKLLILMKEVSASRNYHGRYKGGLYDHVLLLYILAEKIYPEILPKFSLFDVKIIIILHDLEKIYSKSMNIQDERKRNYVAISKEDELEANIEVLRRIRKYKGYK